jgi:hypothetical protein
MVYDIVSPSASVAFTENTLVPIPFVVDILVAAENETRSNS